MAVLAPMPSASVSTATSVKTGWRRSPRSRVANVWHARLDGTPRPMVRCSPGLKTPGTLNAPPPSSSTIQLRTSMHAFMTDLAQSWRLIRRQPGLALAAVTALAMGIGFTTTMFSIMHGGTRALPFTMPMKSWRSRRSTTDAPAAAPPSGRSPFASGRARSQLPGPGGIQVQQVNVSGGATPERMPAAAITTNAFNLLGVTVAQGRAFTTGDASPSAPPVAIISDLVWRQRLNHDASALGATIRINGVTHTIVGIMPPGFGFPINARIWTPLGIDATPTWRRCDPPGVWPPEGGCHRGAGAGRDHP